MNVNMQWKKETKLKLFKVWKFICFKKEQKTKQNKNESNFFKYDN